LPAVCEDAESVVAKREPERPAVINSLMEAVCERENLKKALRRVKASKGRRRDDSGCDPAHVSGSCGSGRQRERCVSHGPQQPWSVARVHYGGAVPGTPRGYFDSLGLPYLEKT
jgi:hypothetical protein